METLEALPAAVESASRAQTREACRLAFVSGQATLAELSIRHGVPYPTLRTWSSQGEWGTIKAGQAVTVETEARQNLENWLAEQRQRQTQRAIRRAERLQQEFDTALAADNPLKPSDLRDIATAEDKVDLLIRRNLGMDESGGGNGGKVSVNILSGSVQIAGAQS